MGQTTQSPHGKKVDLWVETSSQNLRCKLRLKWAPLTSNLFPKTACLQRCCTVLNDLPVAIAVFVVYWLQFFCHGGFRFRKNVQKWTRTYLEKEYARDGFYWKRLMSGWGNERTWITASRWMCWCGFFWTLTANDWPTTTGVCTCPSAVYVGPAAASLYLLALT